MQVINFISNVTMPMLILMIVLYGFKNKNKVFDSFLEGSKRRNKNNN